MAPVWRALADPTRRALLDLLHDGPRTTGALAAAFSSSRFAVMKHLGVLVAARLVVARKQGRERWNHLNAAPLAELYQRWVSPRAARHAAAALTLRAHVETAIPLRGAAAVPRSAGAPALTVERVEVEIDIAAAPARVWKAITEEATKWWRRDFCVNGAASGFVFEAKVGGRVFEDWGEGAGVLWFTILALDPGRSLDLVGHVTPAFGGPSISHVRLELEARGKATRLKISDASWGHVAGACEEKAGGWKLLFGDGLKPWIESGRAAG